MGRMLWKRNKPRLLAVLLAVCLLAACVPAAFAAEGSCGDGLSWQFDGSSLTITGAGAMADYGDGNLPPWYDFREQILSVSLPQGLTHVGSVAFYGCENLAAVSIPGSVTGIGMLAFSGCTAMTMVTFNDGLVDIGDNAFEKCENLLELRLPASVRTIGSHAFYFCSALRYVSIPGAVESYGSGIFSYCHALTRADIGQSAGNLPGWTFYGCEQLTVVNTNEGSLSAASLKVPNSGTPETAAPEVSTPETVAPATDGAQPVVKVTDDATSVLVPGTGETGTEITATVQTPEGWQDVLQQVEGAQNSQTLTGNTDTIQVTVSTRESDTVEKEVLQELSGKKVSLTVQTQSGSRFTVDCTKLPEKVKKDLVLTYTLTPAEDVPEELAGYTVYELSFHQSADILTEIVMALPGDHALRTATLFQQNKKELESLQNVLVDDSGKAHWYVSNVDEKTQYYIGIDVPTGTADSPIIPAELAGVYKVANVYDGVEYKVTGRSSSWNMGLGQVMAILAAVMVGAIVLIGGVMYTMNKRRLKNGYVPQWEDEE